jgi:hypothetical protein
MRRSGGLVALFAVVAMLLLACGDTATGQAPKQDPKKPDPKKPDPKKSDDKAKPKPAEPKKAPEPKPAPVAPPGQSELDGPTIDTSKPTSPLDLVRGLRESDATDLAMEYLAVLERRSLPPDVKTVLPLEAALTRLEAAKDESDAAKRDALIVRAKGEFDQFAKANSSHPRAIEAAVAFARATSFQARSQLARALKLPREGDKDKAAAALVRPIFEDASKKFAAAAKKLDELLAGASVTGTRRTMLGRELNQAQLESGINLFEESRTVVRPSGPKDVAARSEALKAAKKAFKTVGDRDPNNPFSWIAKAWGIECDYELQQVGDADKQAQALRNDAGRYPAAREGVRMLRYFEAARKYRDARSPAELNFARGLGERWLNDYRTPKGSREQFAIQYYVATLRREEAMLTGVKTSKGPDGQTKIESVSAAAMNSFRQADREYRKLIETDNEYSDRAATDRTQVIRLIIGDKLKPAAEYATFEESQMAALVEMSSAMRDEKLAPADRTKKMASAAGYLRRAVSLAGPQDAPKDVLDAKIQWAYANLQGGQPQQAAVLGEHLARTARTPAEAARAGAIAVQAYLASAPGADADDDSRRVAVTVDRKRAMDLAGMLEAKFAGESSTDSIRWMMGGQLYRAGQYAEAFAVLSRISPQFPGATNARLMEGAAAFQAIRGDAKPALPAKEKKAIYDKAVADLKALPEPAPAANAADARLYLRTQQQLVELYLLDTPGGLANAVRVAATIELKSPKFASLSPTVQAIHAMDAERLRLTAVAGQATPLFNAANWSEFNGLVDPILRDMAKRIAEGGTAVARAEKAKGDDSETAGELASAADRLDKFRRERFVLMALQAKIRAGEADQTGDLIDMLEKLGGSIDANAATLAQLLGTVKGQAATLRKQQKPDEADKLVAAVGELFIKFAAKKDLSVKYQYFAAKSLNDLGQSSKAIDLLAGLPDAQPEDLAAKFNDLSDDKKNSVRTHRSAKLELAKAYRQTGQFAKAETVLEAAMGPEGKPGWAAKVLDYRREAILLLEARAAAADGKVMNELWAKANQAWGKLAREYGGVLTQPLPKDEEKKNEAIRNRDQIKPVYFGLFADNQKCLVKANQMILKGKAEALEKRYDSIANAMKTVETQNPDLATEVREKFAEILDETPALKKRYEAAGGKMFLRNADGSLPGADTTN